MDQNTKNNYKEESVKIIIDDLLVIAGRKIEPLLLSEKSIEEIKNSPEILEMFIAIEVLKKIYLQ